MASSLRQRINIKYFMVGYLSLLLLVASVLSGDLTRFLYGLVTVALYAAFDLGWTKLRDHVWYLPVSSWISGLVLANVGPPNPSLWLLVLLPLIAVVGKQLVHLGKSRHIFNPAGLSLLLVTLFVPVVSWWSASVNVWTLVFVLVGGLIILWRQQRWHVVAAFLLVYALGVMAIAALHGADVQALPEVVWSSFANGALVFFATVMLIEPMTSNFPTRANRITFGALVGLFAVASLVGVSYIPIRDLDPLIFGLLLGNLIACLLFLPTAKKPASAALGSQASQAYTGTKL
ncbi:MAG: hypothetical protein WA001_02465 [Patescibacteria group bacterium]